MNTFLYITKKFYNKQFSCSKLIQNKVVAITIKYISITFLCMLKEINLVNCLKKENPLIGLLQQKMQFVFNENT